MKQLQVSFMFQLESLGYFYDNSLNVWKREDYINIGYNDGDEAEERLAKIIRDAKDISLFSSELRNKCADWQTLYHLTSQRGNVLRPFAHLLKGDVLEIGAGCGAISRFLGENGGNILALEGSQRRASIAASRTRDLDNVQVVAERFDQFNPGRQFDAITLIGVLEYAPMFGNGESPEKDLLIQVRKLLKPGGFLFIAIENKLGLKYFAGAPEDHIRQSMYGIEGRYKSGEAKTWGYEELKQLLTETGYRYSDVLLPFPDYKLPTSIITPAGSITTGFDASTLAVQSVMSDPQLPAHLTFSLQNCFPEIFKNKLGVSLANSFIFAASIDTEIPLNDSILAYHYSTQRKHQYAKETVFSQNSKNEIDVAYHFFQKEYREPDTNRYVQIRKEGDKYFRGTLLGQQFINVLANENWQFDDIIKLMKQWLSALEKFIKNEGDKLEFSCQVDFSLPAYFMDAIPQNIIITDEGPVLFDIEWQGIDRIELGHLLFRGILLILNQAKVRPLVGQELITRKEFVQKVMTSLGLVFKEDTLQGYIRKESQFQHQVTGRDINELLLWNEERPLAPVTVKHSHACLYFASNGEEFTEQNTHSFILAPGINTIRCQVNGNNQLPITKLRFDPTDSSGWFTIHSLSIKNNHGEVVWQAGADSEDVDYQDILKLQEGMLNVYYSTSHDPQILLKNVPPLTELYLEAELEIIQNMSLASFLEENNTHPYSPVLKKLNEISAQLEETCLKLAKTDSLNNDVEAKLRQTEDHLDSTTAQLNEKSTQLENIQSQLTAVTSQLTHVNALHAAAMTRINALEASTSWKVTAPLRALGKVRHRTKVLASVTCRIYRQHGLRKIISRGFATLQREGWRGIVGRLRQQRMMQSFHAAAPFTLNAENAVTAQGNSVSAPTVQPTTIVYNQREGYHLKQGEHEYCYVVPAQPDGLATLISDMTIKPLFSIVVPIYNTPLDLLHELIESIEAQWYPQWELILANDCSTDPQLYGALEKITNPKIKIVHLKTNSRISGATNVAIEHATGDYIVFTDHDDLLTPDCLYEMAVCINNEDPDFIYSDEDKLSEDGRYVQPHFKPDWSPDTMMSTMFTCHASCVKKSLLSKTGLLRSEFDGCQDWDFVLRVAEHTNKISHIAKVLYHWRIIPQSIASNLAAKEYVLQASINVRKDALKRRGLAGEVESIKDYPGYFRVNYFPINKPLVSIIIPTRDNYNVLSRCIDSLLKGTKYDNYEIIILDNGSTSPETLSYLEQLSKLDKIKTIRHDHPFNFSELNNIGVSNSRGDVLLFLNDDTEIINDDWLERMIGYAQLPHIGAVGAKLYYPNKKCVQHAGIVNLADGPGHAMLGLNEEEPGYFMRNKLEYNWIAVTGACLMIERHKFEKIGRFDEDFPIAYNDVDLCFRLISSGYYNVVCQAVELYHHESVSRGVDHIDVEKAQRLHMEKQRLYQKHPRYYQYDPFFNINLHPNGINFEVGC
uniref:Bifunctional glycosyltransferase methyltansferase n=1 Tax=Franconibacter pulveris TaxID=435910 RepID=A0A172WYN1_9ENTR|nr:bifunctional glycosyltransferase methyltansferase [Franconibacter pulveris]